MLKFLNHIERTEMISLIAGIILLGIAIIEVVEESEEAGVELEHGLLLFALAHIIRVSAEVYERAHETHKKLKKLKGSS